LPDEEAKMKRRYGHFYTGLLIAVLANTTVSCVSAQYPSRKREQDAEAGRTMRRLISLEFSYRAEHKSYAGLFSELPYEPLANGGSTPCAHGYCYSLNLVRDGFELRARPEKRGESGYRSFYSNQTGGVRFTTEMRDANANDDVLR
jgi:hypothetical protein